jgi:hypothetical protein
VSTTPIDQNVTDTMTAAYRVDEYYLNYNNGHSLSDINYVSAICIYNTITEHFADNQTG